jgi:hypothetical protein
MASGVRVRGGEVITTKAWSSKAATNFVTTEHTEYTEKD